MKSINKPPKCPFCEKKLLKMRDAATKWLECVNYKCTGTSYGYIGADRGTPYPYKQEFMEEQNVTAEG